MKVDRPDLTNVKAEIREYIEALERELQNYASSQKDTSDFESESFNIKTNEPPTTLNVITITVSGIAKRTPRHLYSRQRRGGMGVFDLDASENDPPQIITIADETQSLLLFSNLARSFRLPVSQIFQGVVRDKGQTLVARLQLQPGEYLVAAIADQAKGGIALVSSRGMVRHLRHHVFGEYMRPGTLMFDPRQLGELVAACRTPGDGDLFIATRRGKAIRFPEKLVPPQGGPGIRLEDNDSVVAITAVYPESSVLLADSIGRGTIRLMNTFNPNKSAGGGGKSAMNTDQLIAAITVAENDDIFMISRLSKIIRFMAAEIPAKDSVVQGVNCMALRADEVRAVAITA